MGARLDLTGQRFGRLVVQGFSHKENKHYFWTCKCNCGNTAAVRSCYLKSGITKSCGCLNNEQRQKLGRNQLRKNFNKCIDGTSLTALSRRTPSNNTSGTKGVGHKNKRGKYPVNIMLKGVSYYLGDYENINDAIKARQEAEEKYFAPILEKYKEATK